MRIRGLVVALSLAAVAACSESASGPTTPSAAPTTAVFVGAGDIATCGTTGSAATAALLDRQPGTVFAAGDNAYQNGSEQEYFDCYGPTWGRHRSRTRPVPGNHEYQTPGAIGYFSYFGSLAGPGNLGYYAYTLGAWQMIALNSEVDVSAGSAQAAWLKDQLAATTVGACTAAYWHRPFVSSGPHGDNVDMRDLFEILYDAGVEFLVVGHDHIYERFDRLDASGRPDPVRGIREFIVGTGGAPLTGPVRVRSGSQMQATTWGIIRFDLSPGSYRWQFIAADQSFSDSGFEMCH